jgi:GT2 family glycosyltransferase
LAGYRCLYLPEALVYHKGGGTSSSNPSLFRYYNQRNMELVLRNIPSDLLWKYGWGHFVYTAYQVAKWSFKGEGWNVLKAKFDAFKILWKSGTRQLPIRVKSTEFGKYLASDFSAYAPSTLRSYQGVSQD